MSRRLRAWHRRIGLASLVLLAWLALTGLILNHTSDLGLDGPIDSVRVANWYGLAADCSEEAFLAGAHKIVECGSSLFIDDHRMSAPGDIVGAILWQDMVVIAGSKALILASSMGELVEQLDASLLPGQPARLGVLDGKLVLATGAGLFATDTSLLGWHSISGPVNWARQSTLGDESLSRYESRAAAAELNWTRLIQDLHSGRIMGLTGRILADVGAVSLLILAAIGLLLTRK